MHWSGRNRSLIRTRKLLIYVRRRSINMKISEYDTTRCRFTWMSKNYEQGTMQKQLIRTKTRKNRLKLTKEHETWTIEYMKKILWNNESKFNLLEKTGRSHTSTIHRVLYYIYFRPSNKKNRSFVFQSVLKYQYILHALEPIFEAVSSPMEITPKWFLNASTTFRVSKSLSTYFFITGNKKSHSVPNEGCTADELTS